MFEAEKARQAEQKEQKMEQARNPNGGSGRTQNSMNSQSPPGDSDLSRTETVRYLNESGGEGGDEDTLSVID